MTLLWFWLWVVILDATRLGYGRSHGPARARREALADLFALGGVAAYFNYDTLGLLQAYMRQFLNSHFLGDSQQHAWSLAGAAAVQGLLGRAAAARRTCERGIRIGEGLGDRSVVAYCQEYLVYAVTFAGDIPAATRAAREVMKTTERYLGSSDYARLYTHYVAMRSDAGYSRELCDLVPAELPRIDHRGNDGFSAILRAFLYRESLLLGRTADAARWKAELDAAIPAIRDGFTRRILAIYGISGLLEQGELGPALDAEERSFLAGGVNYHLALGLVMVAYAARERHERAAPEDRPRTRRELRRALARLSSSFARVPVHACHRRVLQAGLAREAGRLGRARRLLERAEALAERADSQWGRFEAARERARLAAARGDPAGARREGERAIELAEARGWRPRAQRVRAELSITERPRDATPLRESLSTVIATSERYVNALLRISLASASTIDPADQARAALDELVRLLGAERACLFTVRPGSDEIVFSAGRDAAFCDIGAAEGFGLTVARTVARTREPAVVTGTEEAVLLGSESAAAHGVKSILCAPLVMHDRFLGVVYLDSRLAKGLFTRDDVRVLLAVSNHIAIAMEMARLAREQVERKALERDLELIAAVQSLFLPSASAHDGARLALQGFYRPATKCGGDWWWYDVEPDGTLTVLVGDVSGHGVAPAMVSAAVGSLYRRLRRASPPGEVLAELHGELCDLARGAYHMTASAVRITPGTATSPPRLSWWNAGAPALLRLPQDGAVEALVTVGAPLGGAEFRIATLERALVPGDRVLLFTDGLFEQELPSGKPLGFRRASRLFEDSRGLTPRDASAGIERGWDEARQDVPQQDDLTFVVIDVR